MRNVGLYRVWDCSFLINDLHLLKMSTSSIIQPEFYHQYFDQEGVVDKWLLVRTPYPVLSTVIGYLTFVLFLGPWYMKSRQAFDLRGLMKVYNLLQVLYNLYMLNLILSSTESVVYMANHSCYPANLTNNCDLRYNFLLLYWHYYFSKFVDLVDTVAMVLRKKQSQVTVLHVYHHSAMVILMWISLKYFRAQQLAGPMLLNNFVHVVMYAYFFLSSFGPAVQKYLWWKRYLTRIQLIQFAMVIAFFSYLYFNSCYVNQVINFIWIANVAIIAAFFVNFYIQTYIVKFRKSRNKLE